MVDNSISRNVNFPRLGVMTHCICPKICFHDGTITLSPREDMCFSHRRLKSFGKVIFVICNLYNGHVTPSDVTFYCHLRKHIFNSVSLKWLRNSSIFVICKVFRIAWRASARPISFSTKGSCSLLPHCSTCGVFWLEKDVFSPFYSSSMILIA